MSTHKPLRKIRCPYCHSSRIKRSHSRGLRDLLYRLFGRRPYRCEVCSRRFHGPRRRHDPDGLTRRDLLYCLGIAVLVALAVRYYTTREPPVEP